MSKLTMLGMYNYDNTLFDGLKLPEGIERETCINEIISRCDEFEIVYPNIEFLKFKIGHFGAKHYRTFDKWIKALGIEYDPLFNFDRNEEYEDITSGSASGTTKGKSGTELQSDNRGNTERQVSAFDADDYSPKEKNIDATGNTTKTDGTDESETSSKTDSKVTHKARLYGNIGVTTSQQMLQSELDIARFNIYSQIADLFAEEFCIMVY